MKTEFVDGEFFALVDAGNIDEAVDYSIHHIPDYLFKYYSLSDGQHCKEKQLDQKKLKTLRSNANWFDLSCNQNDPLDMRMAYIKNNGQAHPTQIDAAKLLLEQIQQSIVLACFTNTDEFNLPMWEFYANQHRGYCVKYRIDKKEVFWKILYNKDRMPISTIPINLIYEMSESTRQGSETEKLKWYRYVMFMLLNSKHTSWAYEKEYRILFPAEHGKGVILRNKDIGITPQAVYLGIKCLDHYKHDIIDICTNNLKCDCFESFLSQSKILDFKKAN